MSIKETATIQKNDDDELFFKLSDEMWEELESQGWQVGDTLNWSDNDDGTYSITKQEPEETEWVLVEALSQFKVSYMIEVPKGKSEYALDTVAMEQATECFQEHLRPTDIILGHKVLTKEEALKLCDEKNEYSAQWDEETKIRNFFTPMENK